MGSRAGTKNKPKDKLLEALRQEFGRDFNAVVRAARRAHQSGRQADLLLATVEDQEQSVEERAAAFDHYQRFAGIELQALTLVARHTIPAKRPVDDKQDDGPAITGIEVKFLSAAGEFNQEDSDDA